MRILDIQQNTPEWLLMRRSKIGASDAPIIVGKSPYKTPYQLWKEKLLNEEEKITYIMERGSLLEAVARQWYCEKTQKEWTPTVIQSSENEWQIASLDGFNSDEKYLIEIKCPGTLFISKFGNKANSVIPPHWMYQIQHQLFVSDYSECKLILFSESQKHIATIKRDEKLIKKLNKEEEQFYKKNMLEFIPPDLSDKDFILREDDEWKKLAEERKQINKEMKELKNRDNENRKALIDLAQEKSSQGYDIRVAKYFKNGGIDYSKMAEANEINLKDYQKDGSFCWRITINED